MKNRRIVDSWNKIAPDGAADERMLAAILARNHSEHGKTERGRIYPMSKVLNRKRLAPIAACFVAVIVLVGVFGNNAGWFGGKSYTVDLGGGGILSFNRTNVGAAAFDLGWDEDWGELIDRELSESERASLFGDLPVAGGNATFRSVDNAFMHFEGEVGEAGDAKVILAANGHPVSDTIVDVEGNAEVSEINGIPVTAGYFVTDANSKGVKDIIFVASFDIDGTTVHVEVGGAEADGDALRAKIGDVIDQLTANPPDVSAVTAE